MDLSEGLDSSFVDENGEEMRAYLEQTGILRAYEYFLMQLLKNGPPKTETLNEYCAKEIERFGRRWKAHERYHQSSTIGGSIAGGTEKRRVAWDSPNTAETTTPQTRLDRSTHTPYSMSSTPGVDFESSALDKENQSLLHNMSSQDHSASKRAQNASPSSVFSMASVRPGSAPAGTPSQGRSPSPGAQPSARSPPLDECRPPSRTEILAQPKGTLIRGGSPYHYRTGSPAMMAPQYSVNADVLFDAFHKSFPVTVRQMRVLYSHASGMIPENSVFLEIVEFQNVIDPVGSLSRAYISRIWTALMDPNTNGVDFYDAMVALVGACVGDPREKIRLAFEIICDSAEDAESGQMGVRGGREAELAALDNESMYKLLLSYFVLSRCIAASIPSGVDLVTLEAREETSETIAKFIRSQFNVDEATNNIVEFVEFLYEEADTDANFCVDYEEFTDWVTKPSLWASARKIGMASKWIDLFGVGALNTLAM